MEICTVRIILEKLAERQDSECCKADFWRVRRIVCLEILRCYSESISMKVSDLIIYIMKIMWRDIKKGFLQWLTEGNPNLDVNGQNKWAPTL